ncbi:MAG: SMP-30/gluconolactonase/LRE family protein [Janthinobacterium lividum]
MKFKSSLPVAFIMMSLTVSAQNDPPESPKLIEVASFDHYQPIGVAVTKTGRTFVTFPRNKIYEYGVAEITGGQKKPYPDAEWNRYDSTKAETHFINAQAAWPDDEDNLWILDPSNPMDGATISTGVKLLKINLSTNKVERVYRFEDLPREKIALNDVRIDNRRQLAYLSEPKTASIIILDLKTGKSRMVLKEDKSTKAEPGFKLHIDGKDVIDQTGKPFSSNVNGIALTKDGKYFYFRAINQTKLYRILADDLANPALTDAQLSAKVETVGETGISHGMIADAKGNIFSSDSPNKAIRYVTADGKFETLVKDKRLIWPDTFSVGNDGYLYVTCSQINRTKKYNGGEDKVEYPFRLYKIKLP